MDCVSGQPELKFTSLTCTCLDLDGDGLTRCEECDDSNSAVRPGAPQVCDGVNNDCLNASWPALTNTNEGDDDGDHFSECGGDCDDTQPATYPGAPTEINDGRDNQCGTGIGGGIVDEITGTVRFADPSNHDLMSWPPQAGATRYEVARALAPSFSGTCSRFAVPAPAWTDPQRPGAGGAFYYLVRSLEPYAGSWGQASSGAERVNVCSPLAASGSPPYEPDVKIDEAAIVP